VLVRAGRAARDWLNRAGVEPHNPAGYFVAACLWREETAHRPIPLPCWSAPVLYHHRLGLRIGLDLMAQFLECVTAAAQIGLRELARLLEAEKRRVDIRATARSRLPDALNAMLRAGRHRRFPGRIDSCHAARCPWIIGQNDGGRPRAGGDWPGLLAGFRTDLTQLWKPTYPH
jgi:hypothetical protein